MEKTIAPRIEAHQVNFTMINATIERAKDFVKKNEYQFKVTAGLEEINESSFNEALIKLSLKKRKKLAASIWKINNHPTLKNVNLFFHFLMKEVMKSELRVRVIKSAKQLAIEEKRKAYKDALAKLKGVYSEYKSEKGDFYKNRLTKGQEVV